MTLSLHLQGDRHLVSSSVSRGQSPQVAAEPGSRALAANEDEVAALLDGLEAELEEDLEQDEPQFSTVPDAPLEIEALNGLESVSR